MSLSPIALQISILREALEEQQKYVRKRPLDLSLDEKCCNEMKKLQQLMFGQKKRSLNFVDLSQLYSILVDSEKSFDAGIQRIMGKTFGSMVVDTHNGNSLWEIAKVAKEDIFRACLIGVVDEWAQMGTEKENRKEAKSRILNFLTNPNQTDLDLNFLFLQDLPDIFHGEITKRLTTLKVAYNEIIILPESIGNLTALQSLDISSNKLTRLPESIGNLTALQSLDISSNKLTRLPESIGNLTALQSLDLEYNQLIELPESIGNLTALQSLDGAYNQLRELPESIGNLTALQSLNISSNKLTRLPESIGNLTALQSLNVAYNQLRELPESIGNLAALQSLDISGNNLTELPESIGNLVALEDLDTSYMEIRAIPETIKSLTRLRKLNIHGNLFVNLPEWVRDLVELKELDASIPGITFLPDWIGDLINLEKLSVCDIGELTGLPDSIGNLSNLEELEIFSNKITVLPESMRKLRNLTSLWMGDNCLESVPEWVGTLSELECLDLNNNKLVALHESIGNLRKLKKLDFEQNSLLASLPNTVLQLPNTCKVNIENCGFSFRFIDNLQAIVNAPGYSGPRISFSIQETGLYEAKTLEEALKNLSKIAERQIKFSEDLMDASQKSLLEIWLNRMCEIADYKSSEESKKQIARKVLNYLEETVTNEEFRGIFYQAIADATRTCGDKVALSLLYIGLAYDESKIDLRDTQNLAQFLIRGVFVISLLEDVARAKIPTLKLVDEIEVYLGYPILLKERLQIPINIGKMLYLRCAGLTDQDLSNAETYVKKQIENKDAVCNFLVDQPRWEKALESSFPAETAKLKAERMSKLEEELSQVSELDKEYKNALKNLTNKLINWENLS